MKRYLKKLGAITLAIAFVVGFAFVTKARIWNPETTTGSTSATLTYTLSKSGTTYTVLNQSSNFSSSGSTFDTVFAAAITDAGSNPAEIDLGAGTFVVTSGISLGRGNIHIHGQGAGVTTIQASASCTNCDSGAFFKDDPTQSATAYSLTSDANVGDLTLTMSSANLISSGIIAGDYIILYSSLSIDSEFSSRNQGELHRVVSVNTGTGVITIGAANNGTHVYQTMTVANSAKVAKLTMYENVTISGITFSDAATSRPNTLGVGQVLFRFIRNLTIQNCQFRDMFNAGLMIWQDWNTKIVSNDFRDIKDVNPTANVFYGVVVRGASINTDVVGNTFDNMRHGATQGAGTTTYYAGTTRSYTISGNTSTGTFTSHFDVHQGAEGCTISNNTMVGDDGSANGIQARSPCTISGNTIIGVLGKGVSLFGRATGSTVTGNTIKGATDGVFINPGVDNVVISGNTINGGTRGISLSRTTATVTMTIASPAVITYTAHALAPGAQIVFTTSGALPTGITAGTIYYIISEGMTTNTFEIAATPTGSAINTTGSQSGTHTAKITGGNNSIITDNNIFNNTSVGIDSNSQVKVKITNNKFNNNTLPFQIANTDSTATAWQITGNYSSNNTSTNEPTLLGTNHVIKGNFGFAGNTVRFLKPTFWGIAATSQTATVGRVYMENFQVDEEIKCSSITYIKAATQAGNVTVGIYKGVAEDTSNAATLVVQSADTAVSAGTNIDQTVSFTSSTLTPGRYYAAIEFSDVTNTYMRNTNQTQFTGIGQYYDRGGGYGTLTDPAPSPTSTGSAIPAVIIGCTPSIF